MAAVKTPLAWPGDLSGSFHHRAVRGNSGSAGRDRQKAASKAGLLELDYEERTARRSARTAA